MSSKRSRSTSIKQMSDGELISEYINNNSNKAFSELHKRYKKQIYGFIMSMVKDVNIADDIYQRTYLKILEKIDENYNHAGKFKSWAMTIAYNNCIDYFRYKKRFVDPDALSDDHYDFFEAVEDDDDPESLYLRNEERVILNKGIKTLNKEQQVIVDYRDKDFMYKDIAKEEGISINTALGRMRYARINLEKYADKHNEIK